MKFSPLVILSVCCLAAKSAAAFTVNALMTNSATGRHHSLLFLASEESSCTNVAASNGDGNPLGLTPELKKITDAFEMIGDDKLRYKQLLYMANQLPPLEQPEKVMIPQNKVPGCLSTVYVDGTATLDEESGEYLIDFVGDSDGLLTKGLVALLVRYVCSRMIWMVIFVCL